MTKKELIKELKAIADIQGDYTKGDEEDHHMAADILLLNYISDDEVTTAYHSIDKWYA